MIERVLAFLVTWLLLGLAVGWVVGTVNKLPEDE
jgi:hypothetical protein